MRARERLRTLSGQYSRHGRRSIAAWLQREGWLPLPGGAAV